jgi:hypothetical protein
MNVRPYAYGTKKKSDSRISEILLCAKFILFKNYLILVSKLLVVNTFIYTFK